MDEIHDSAKLANLWLIRCLLVQPLLSIRSRVKKALEFLPLMMIDPLRDNFHIIFFIFVGNVKTFGSLQLTTRRYAPRQNYFLCNTMYLLQVCFALLTDIIKDTFFFIARDEHRVFIARLLPADAFILANRAISDKLVSLSEGIRAIHVKRLLNYSSVYAIFFAPLTELTRFAINRVL